MTMLAADPRVQLILSDESIDKLSTTNDPTVLNTIPAVIAHDSLNTQNLSENERHSAEEELTRAISTNRDLVTILKETVKFFVTSHSEDSKRSLLGTLMKRINRHIEVDVNHSPSPVTEHAGETQQHGFRIRSLSHSIE